MRGLWFKELRSLRPFLLLVALLMALGFGFEMLTDLPHLRPLAETADEYVASKDSALVTLVLLFALASGLLVREYDEGTLEFLDSDLVYPLGEVFVEALVQCYGEPAVGALAAALTRPEAPQGLAGMELWRDVFQACGYSLEEVLNIFYARLDEQVQRQRQAIDRLPRLQAAVRVEDGDVVVQTRGESVEGWSSVCRFRQAEDTPDRQYLFGISLEDGVFRLPQSFFPDGHCWYQIGLSDGGQRVLWEPWQRVRLGSG